MVQTKVEVFNLAIDIVKDTALQTPDDPRPTARWHDRNYAHTVRSVLRTYIWNFAKEYVSIPEEATAPPHTWSHAYAKPTGFIRLLPPRLYGNRYGSPVPHEVVGDLIYTNATAPFRATIIKDQQDPATWDPLFTEIVRCQLALGMANKFTNKNKFIELASQMLSRAIEKAEEIETLEGSPEPVEQFDILRVRGFNGDDPYGYGRY